MRMGCRDLLKIKRMQREALLKPFYLAKLHTFIYKPATCLNLLTALKLTHEQYNSNRNELSKELEVFVVLCGEVRWGEVRGCWHVCVCRRMSVSYYRTVMNQTVRWICCESADLCTSFSPAPEQLLSFILQFQIYFLHFHKQIIIFNHIFTWACSKHTAYAA